MAGSIATAYVDLKANDAGFASSITDSAGKAATSAGGRFKSGFGSALKGIGVGVAGALAVGLGAVAIGASKAITAGSDLNETISKSNTIFGSSAGEISKWSDTAATSLGLSKGEAMAAAAGFGNSFTQMGLGSKAAAKLSKDFVQVSADLGSFNNLSTGDVQERFAAALNGEYDSIQKVLPGINAARVEKEALAATGKKNAKQLTAEDKALAINAIAHKDGAKAMGDFEKTSGGLANQQKILQAQLQTSKEKLGTALLPIATKVVSFLNTTMIPAFTAIGDKVGPALSGLGAKFAPLLAAIAPIGTVLSGMFSGGTLTAGISLFKGLISGIAPIFNGIKAVVMAIAPIVVSVFTTLVTTLNANLPAIKSIFASIGSTLSSIGTIITVVWSKIGPIILPIITTVFGTIFGILKGAFTIISGIFKLIASVMTGNWSGAWSAIKQIVSGAVGVIKSVVMGGFNLVKGIVTSVGGVIRSTFGSAWNAAVAAVSRGVSSVIGKVKNLQSSVKGALSGAASWLVSAGGNIVQGLINGIRNMIGNAASAAAEMASSAINAAKAKLHINSPSRVFLEMGQFVTQGLVNGMDASAAAAGGANLAGGAISGFGSPSATLRASSKALGSNGGTNTAANASSRSRVIVLEADGYLRGIVQDEMADTAAYANWNG